jgi:hypothetical protein
VGYTGSIGTQGYWGSNGDTGYTGSKGVGYTGSAGNAGTNGTAGYWGSVGYTGSASTVAGAQGYWGSVGYTGSASTVAGAQGYWGSVGYTGSWGYYGSVGYTGSKGDKGDAGTGGGGSGLSFADYFTVTWSAATAINTSLNVYAGKIISISLSGNDMTVNHSSLTECVMFFSNGLSSGTYKYVMGPTASGIAMSATSLPSATGAPGGGQGGTFHITNFSATTSGSTVGGTTTVYFIFKS